MKNQPPKPNDEERRQYKAQLKQALIDLDVDWCVRFLCRRPVAQFVVMRTMHTARLKCNEIPENLKEESRQWIKQNLFVK